MLTDSCAHHNFPEPILLGRKRWWGITCLQAAAEAAGSAERAAPPPVHTAGSPQIRLGRAAGRELPSLPGKAPHGGPCSAHLTLGLPCRASRTPRYGDKGRGEGLSTVLAWLRPYSPRGVRTDVFTGCRASAVPQLPPSHKAETPQPDI